MLASACRVFSDVSITGPVQAGCGSCALSLIAGSATASLLAVLASACRVFSDVSITGPVQAGYAGAGARSV